ncbi:hypothetical protein [Pseudomonas fluorescens]|uniref:Uncharacterized protein n=1 Tax=Pseudomonas fluorescens TaxID=294 RepID=A0A5E7U3E0_PSEFL|nr:hypothetical protein [Pseudomonas fluorescens]VVO12968.1 hypothetical protein PS833_03578 [Pseudomonas fluorescens]VVQ04428.1 hypothetical protein PS914_04397 [Pseudomonas fluorescens]
MTRKILTDTDLDRDDEMARNTELFFEADRLDAIAYKILDEVCDRPLALAKFTEAKARADTKRIEAYQDWMRIQGQMKK